MIFDVLKNRWLRKQSENLKKASRRSSTSKPVNMVVLYDADLTKSPLFAHKWMEHLEVQQAQWVGFTTDAKRVASDEEILIHSKSIGWTGGVIADNLKKLLERQFDLQINFFDQNDVLRSYVALALSSGIKVGLPSQEESLYDLAINVKLEQDELFLTELKKYLTIITK